MFPFSAAIQDGVLFITLYHLVYSFMVDAICTSCTQQLKHTHIHTYSHPPQKLRETKKSVEQPFGIFFFFCCFMVERFHHATQDEANEWNVKILCNSKNKTAQGLPFEDIIGTRSGVEQIKQTALYTQQQPECGAANCPLLRIEESGFYKYLCT